MLWNSTIIIAIVLIASITCYWTYEDGDNGPADWYREYKDCGGARQSPIDILSYEDAQNVNFPSFERNDVYNASQFYVLSKNSHTVSVIPQFENGERASISGGPLTGRYLLDHLHFHWGDENIYGSEHTLVGNPAALEMHAVHYNDKYPNVSVAANYPDGLAVIGYLYNVKTLVVNAELAKVTMKLQFFQKSEDTEIMAPDKLELANLVVPFDDNYSSYLGSLTTPPCSEAVTWIVYNQMLAVSREQILLFRSLFKSTPSLYNNFRPVQNLNGRIVQYKTIS